MFTKSPRIFPLVHHCQGTLPDLGEELLQVLAGEGGVDGVLVAGHEVGEGHGLGVLARGVQQRVQQRHRARHQQGPQPGQLAQPLRLLATDLPRVHRVVIHVIIILHHDKYDMIIEICRTRASQF